MPTLPTYGAPREQESQLRVPSAPPAAFGVSANVDLSGVSDVVSKMVTEAKYHADQVAVSDADAKLVRAKTARLWDPNTGAMNARGKDAIPVSGSAQKGFQDDASALEQGLANEDQKRAFRQRADMHYADLGGQLGQHVATQIKQYDVDTTNGHLDALSDSALKSYQDDHTVQQAVDQTRAVLTDYWQRNGHGDGSGVDAFAQQHIDDRISAIRSTIFKQLSDTGQDLAAAAYLKQHQADFVAKDLLPLEKVAEVGSTRAASLQAAQGIVTRAPTLSAAMAEVDKIQDPKIQDATAERVRRHFNDLAADMTHQRQQAFEQASALTEAGHDVPLTTRVLLTPEENTALAHRADQLRHPKQTTDIDTYHSLLNTAGLPNSHQHWLDMDLSQYRGKLSDADFKSLVRKQEADRQAVAKRAESRAHSDDVRADSRAYSDSVHTARQQAAAAKKQADKAANLAAHTRMIDSLTHPQNYKPSVPGAPITKAGGGDPSKPKTTSLVPQSWLDHAQENPDYADYLMHMGQELG